MKDEIPHLCLFISEIFLQESQMQQNDADLCAHLNLHENQLQPRLREVSYSKAERARKRCRGTDHNEAAEWDG